MKPTNTKQTGKFSSMLTATMTRQLTRNILKRKDGSFWIKTLKSQADARKIRKRALSEGLVVPPVAVFSITNRCNLNCIGCYANAQNRNIEKELPQERIPSLFEEVSKSGTRVMIIAGGEPLMRPEVLRAAAERKEMIFPVFTNGTLLQNGNSELFSESNNLIPVLSIDGDRKETDTRRGKGISEKLDMAIENLNRNRTFFGTSITLTSKNFDEAMSPSFINHYFEKGCRLFFFIEYVPSCSGNDENCLTEDQKNRLVSRIENLKLIFPSEFIALPGNEEQFGGCLASGRGFIHISSTGDVEPCPFAPFSDVNLKNKSYKEALRSDLLKKIRENHHLLSEKEGGCTLWSNREFISKQLGTKERKSFRKHKVGSVDGEAA